MWILGLCVTNRIISCSYNEDEATDFSKYARDGIRETRSVSHQIIYTDIFPESYIPGKVSFGKWALSGQHFSFKSTGIGGGVTGKGGTVVITDDLVKDVEVAIDEPALDKIWRWYRGTFLSRKEENALEIMMGTPWATKDQFARIRKIQPNKWYLLSMPVCDFNDPESPMLCPPLMSRESYNDNRELMIHEIFMANYHMQPIDLIGKLYTDIKTYTKKPEYFESINAYIDAADTGDDYLCVIVYGVFEGEGWILDVLYTKEGMEITEPQTAELLYENEAKLTRIESQSGGRGFARAVEKILWEEYKTKRCIIKPFHQSENKRARIISQSNYVMQHIYLPFNWQDRWPEFANAIISYQKEGKNKHDDGPDALTGCAESIIKPQKITAGEPIFRGV
jgi:predicted phage terminase large subunit-like protein